MNLPLALWKTPHFLLSMGIEDGFTWTDLTPAIRRLAVQEADRAIESGELYVSENLKPADVPRWLKIWPRRNRAAVASHDDRWLAAQLVKDEFLDEKSARLLASQHFKRFYIAGVCRQALKLGQKHVWVYRARPSENPRPSSEELIGTKWDAAELLEAMRTIKGMHRCKLTQAGSGLAVQLESPLAKASA
jgi:hypothetical protein